MLGLASGIADAQARVGALERDRARMEGELGRLRDFAHALRGMGVVANWQRIVEGLEALEGVAKRLDEEAEACTKFRKMMEEPGGPLDQVKASNEVKKAMKLMIIWAGGFAAICTGALQVGWLVWSWWKDL